jgi:thiamine pyrophosphate-dependent acetolactate synthase large subunit-like protein
VLEFSLAVSFLPSSQVAFEQATEVEEQLVVRAVPQDVQEHPINKDYKKVKNELRTKTLYNRALCQ